MKNILLLSILSYFLFISCEYYNTQKPSIEESISTDSNIQKLLKELKNPHSDNVLVVAHRGDWRNAPENSVQAIKNAIDMGVDMIEIDVQMTRDSALVLMHDKTISRTTTGKGEVSEWTIDSLKTLYLRNGANHPTEHRIPTLEEAMLACKGKILVNLDKCYPYFDKAYQILKKTGTIDHVVMKGNVPYSQLKEEFGQYLEEVIYMPVVDLNNPDATKIIEGYQKNLKPVAFELIFSEVNESVLKNLENLDQSDTRIWVNSLWPSLNGGHTDDRALIDSEANYGWLLDKGVSIIQTDRPEFLINYLKSNKKYE